MAVLISCVPTAAAACRVYCYYHHHLVFFIFFRVAKSYNLVVNLAIEISLRFF